MSTYASVLIPRFEYYSRQVTITEDSNDEILFRESVGVDLTATITAGTYTWGALSYQVKVAMEAVGASTYTVRYSYSDRKYTIQSDGTGGGGLLQLDVGGATYDALPTLGFSVDTSGFLVYTSDTAVPSLSTLDFTQVLKRPRTVREVTREDLILETGRVESVSFGGIDTYSFTVEWETPAVAQAYYDMVTDVAEHGGSVQFYPDKTATTEYADVTFVDSEFDFREQTDQLLYRHYAFSIGLRLAYPQTGTLDLRALIDRRPSS